jgi:hypothetical protein
LSVPVALAPIARLAARSGSAPMSSGMAMALIV